MKKSVILQRSFTMAWLLVAVTILFYCLDYYFRIVPALVVPELLRQYHSGPKLIGSFYSAFYLGYLLMQLPSGYLLDRFAFKKIMGLSIGVCVLFFVLFVWLQTPWLGVLSRFFIGGMSAFSFVAVLYVARHYLPRHYFSLIAGVAIGAGTIVAAGAQAFSAVLITGSPWQLVLTLQACWGFAVVAMVLFFPLKRLHKLADEKTPPLKIMLSSLKGFAKNKIILINGIVGSLFYLPTSIFAAAWGITFLRQSYHLTMADASLGILMLFMGWAIGSPWIGYYAEQSKKFARWIFSSAMLMVFLSCVMLYFPAQVGELIYLLLFLFGLLSSTQVLIWKIFSLHCPLELTGLGVAFTNMLVVLGGSLFHFLVSCFITVGPASQLNLISALSILPVIFFVTALLSLALRSSH